MYEEYKKILKQNLDEDRYYHSLCVSKKAVYLAKKYNADIKKAELAGLLHDITKNFTKAEQLNFFGKFDIILSDEEKASPKLWHAISGAYYVKNVLKIDDKEIFDAIRYHTTGKADMTLLEKVIFTADFISDDRDYPDIAVIKDLSEKSLEEAMIYGLSYTINDLIKNRLPVHPCTLAAYNFLITESKSKE